MARVRISKTPKALSGLEMKMRPGLYGTNGNRQFTLPNQVNSQRFSQQPVDVRDTLQPVAREGANLEAEKGETALVNIDGVPAHFKIGGKRHSKGGTPLNLPDNSFIFSDTAKMKIKDPILIAQFGMVPKKAGYTPAEIAKRYDINTFRKILADPNSEDVERKTAEMMISNYNMKLAKLALVQESTKGFPQGIPAVAMPYIMANEINPEELFETQGQEEQPDADMGVSRYGGIPRAQKGLTHKDSVKHQANKILKYEQLRGGPGGAPLPYYSDPKYNTMLMDKILPEVNKIMPNASAMEKGEAMDLIFNSGWDNKTSKITKDPRAFALQEYYRENDGSKLDADGKWPGRKNAPYSFDQEYNNTIGKLPENQRRILMNKGRDWYYQNTAPKESTWDLKTQGAHPDYKDTWYGRIWNTNDFNEFDPNNPNFTPKRYGGNMVSQFPTKQYGGLPTAQTGKLVNPDSSFFVQKPKTVVPITQQPMAAGFTQAATTSANLPLQVNNPDLQYTQPGVLSNLADFSLEVLSAPQKLAMLAGTGLFGDEARWEMPSETINRNNMNKFGKPKYPFTAFMADFVSPNLVYGAVKAGARGAVVAFEKGVSHAVSRDVAKVATDASFKTLKSLKLPQAEAEKIIISSGRSVTPKRIAVVTKAYEEGTAKAIQLVKKKPALANAPDALATKISNTTLKSASRENLKRTAKDVKYEIGQGVEYVYDQFGNKIVKPIVKKVKEKWPEVVNAAEAAYDFTKGAAPVVRPLGPSFVKNVLAARDKYNDWKQVGDNEYVNVNYPGKLYQINKDQTAYEEIDPNVKIIKKPANTMTQTSDMTDKEALQSIDSTQTVEPDFEELEEID